MCDSRREIKIKTINDYMDHSTKTPMRTEGENTLKANRSSGKKKKHFTFVSNDKSLYQEEEK